MSKVAKKDFSNFCHFHREYGHNTKDCLILKKKIKALVHQDYLWTYIGQLKGTETPSHQLQLAMEPPMGNRSTGSLVDTITEGSSRG